MLRNAPPASADIAALEARATNLRRHMLTMARGQGQGYIGQGLGIADVLAALYFHELRYDPNDVGWPERDRFLLSTGHYSIALWAAFAELGIIPHEELSTYGADGSRVRAILRDHRRIPAPSPGPLIIRSRLLVAPRLPAALDSYMTI